MAKLVTTGISNGFDIWIFNVDDKQIKCQVNTYGPSWGTYTGYIYKVIGRNNI